MPSSQVALLKLYREYNDSAFALWKASAKWTVAEYVADGEAVKTDLQKYREDFKKVGSEASNASINLGWAGTKRNDDDCGSELCSLLFALLTDHHHRPLPLPAPCAYSLHGAPGGSPIRH